MKKIATKRPTKKPQRMPPGWTLKEVQELAEYYDNQSEDEQLAEHEAARKKTGQTMLDVPTELVPEILALIESKKKQPRRKSKVLN